MFFCYKCRKEEHCANKCLQRGIHEINEEEYSSYSSYILDFKLHEIANEIDLEVSSQSFSDEGPRACWLYQRPMQMYFK